LYRCHPLKNRSQNSEVAHTSGYPPSAFFWSSRLYRWSADEASPQSPDHSTGLERTIVQYYLGRISVVFDTTEQLTNSWERFK